MRQRFRATVSVRGRVSATLIALLFSGAAYGNTVCQGYPSVALSPVGLVQLNIGHGTWYLCSTTSTHGTFSPEGCRSLLAMLIAARAAGQPFRFIFNTTLPCSGLGDWATPNPQPFYFHPVD